MKNLKTLILTAGLTAFSFAYVGCPPNPPGLPAAATPVMDTLTSSDPTGTPNLPGAPALYSTILKFHVPDGTDIQVAVDGWIVRQSSTGDDGSYTVLSE